MTRMKKACAVIASALLLGTACAGSGSGSGDPEGSLIDALEALLQTDAYTQTITFQSDADSLVALSEGDLDEGSATKILDSSIVISAAEADDPADATAEVIFNIAGTNSLEIRFTEGHLYLRADVAHLLETFGEDPAQLDTIAREVQGQPGLEWVDEALAGEWVVVRDAAALAQQMGGGTTLSGEQQKQLVNDLLQSIEEHATVTDEGEDEAGQHVAASLPLRETLQDLIQSLGPAAGMAGGDLQGSLDEIPNEDIVIDFWIDDGTVTQLAVDILQFQEAIEESGEEFPEGVEEFAVLVQIEEFDGNVEAVADAVEIDTAALTQAFGGLLGGGLGGAPSTGGSSEFNCDMLKGAPPEVIELYAEECPELQK